MNAEKFSEALGEISDRYVSEAITYRKKSSRKSLVKWASIAACLAIIIFAAPILNRISSVNEDPFEQELIIEFNDKIYSVVSSSESAAYENYNLEESITADMLGEYLTEVTIQVDNDGNKETFKLYRYINSPLTEYNWFPRLIAVSGDGTYYHALIGSNFNAEEQTAEEVLSVYGISSAESIISIENEEGTKIDDRQFIESFYEGLFTSEYGDNDFLQGRVYENTGIDESEIGDLYSKHAEDMVHLKVKLSNGLVIGVSFTSHNYAKVDHGLYFKVDDNWLELVTAFRH